jgi:lipoprotein-anchoring transpeptidase ErfK/SrfK
MKQTESNAKLAHTVVLTAIAVLLVTQAVAQENRARAQRQLIVSIPDRKLAVLENGHVLRVFTVAVGASVSPSPTGEFQIVNRVSHPTYYHPGQVIPAGNDNPLGPRWIGLNLKGYGIHGTNVPSSIGKAASHGCIRLRNRDVEQLFDMVRPGDSVDIRAQPDDETAELFGGEPTDSTTLAQSVPQITAGGGQ